MTVHFQMSVSAEWIAALDNWRREQTIIPSRSQAVRQLVNQGLGGDKEDRFRRAPESRRPKDD